MKALYIGVLVLTVLFTVTIHAEDGGGEDDKILIAAEAIRELPCDGGGNEKYGSKKYVKEGIDTYSIFYYFDSTNNGNLGCPIRVITRIRVSPDKETADRDYEKTLWSAHVGIRSSSANTLKDNDFYSFGDRSDFSYIVANDEKVGLYFITQKGNITYAVNMWPIKLDVGQRFGKIFEKRFSYLLKNQTKYLGKKSKT